MTMIASEIRAPRALGISSITILCIALFAHSAIADEVHLASSSSLEPVLRATKRLDTLTEVNSAVNSSSNEKFESKLKSVEDELDKFQNFIQSTLQDTTSPATDRTLSEIKNCVNGARESIKRLKPDYPWDLNYALKIVDFQAEALKLRIVLADLIQGRSITSQITGIDAQNAFVEKAQNLAKLLNSLNSEMNDLRVNIETEKAAERLQDEMVNDRKHNDTWDIRALQVSIAELQESMKNHRKQQQDEIIRFEKELLQKVHLFEHEIQELREKITQNDISVKKMDMSLRLARAIKLGWFFKAEKMLKESDNSTFTYVIGEVYNNRSDNFLLLVRFAESIKDIDCKFKVYEAIYHEMINNTHHSTWKWLRLRKSIQTNILDRSPNATWARSLYETLEREIETTMSLENFLSEDESAKVTLTDDDCFQCMVDVCEEMIQKAIKNSTKEILTRGLSKLNKLEEKIAFNVAAFQIIQQRNEVYTKSSIRFARHMKTTMDDADYQSIREEVRSRYEEIKETLPKSVKNIVFLETICLRSVKLNEYLYASNDRLPYSRWRRYAFTWISGSKSDSSRFDWTVIFVNDDNEIKLRNDMYSQTIYGEEYGTDCTSCHVPDHGRGVFVWNEEDHNCKHSNCYWTINVHNDFVSFENVHFKGEFLIADGSIKQDENRRRVFMRPLNETDYQSTEWDVTDCS